MMEAIQQADASHSQRAGNISDFWRLHLATLSGTVGQLEAEQWLIEMEYLLKVARVLDTDMVNIIKI